MDKWSEHIDNKFGGCDVPYAPTAKPTTFEEQCQRFVEALRPVAKVLSDMIEAVRPTIEKICVTLNSLLDEVLRTYPNKRVVYLASHGKPRVRKKNRRRIIKWLQAQKYDYDREDE